jgi:hypothetical protein
MKRDRSLLLNGLGKSGKKRIEKKDRKKLKSLKKGII